MDSDMEERIADRLDEIYVELLSSLQSIEEDEPDEDDDAVYVDIINWKMLCGAYVYLYQEYVSTRQKVTH